MSSAAEAVGLTKFNAYGIAYEWDRLSGFGTLPFNSEDNNQIEFAYGKTLGRKAWEACGKPKILR